MQRNAACCCEMHWKTNCVHEHIHQHKAIKITWCLHYCIAKTVTELHIRFMKYWIVHVDLQIERIFLPLGFSIIHCIYVFVVISLGKNLHQRWILARRGARVHCSLELGCIFGLFQTALSWSTAIANLHSLHSKDMQESWWNILPCRTGTVLVSTVTEMILWIHVDWISGSFKHACKQQQYIALEWAS